MGMPRRELPQEWLEYTRMVGTNIQRARVRQGYSQEQVAYAAGLSRYSLQLFERGWVSKDRPANPQLSSIMAIAQVLEVSLDELLPEKWPLLVQGEPVRQNQAADGNKV